MLLIQNQSINPYFNLALEEYLFRHKEESCIMLWRNSKSVIIGKHQNPLKEVNLPFAEEHNLPIVRRLSGGGTVYHDEGNLNFTLILTRDTDMVVDFKRYMAPIYNALKEMIPEVEYSPRNDLFLRGRKFSGNAEHAVKRRILHHGTLLFNANLDFLEAAIKPIGLRIEDKAVESVRSRVVNLMEEIHPPMDIMQFKNYLDQKLLDYFDGMSPYQLSKEEIEEVNQLAREKYQTWDWNFGYSPKYSIQIELNDNHLSGNLIFFIKKGRIETITGSAELATLLEYLKDEFVGKRHKRDEINLSLDNLLSKKHISAEVFNQILKQII